MGNGFEKRSEITMIRLTKSINHRLKAYASTTRRTRAEVIRMAIELGMPMLEKSPEIMFKGEGAGG